MLDVSLLFANYDASWISTSDGSEGVWFGIGFDTTKLANSNFVVCFCKFFGGNTCALSC